MNRGHNLLPHDLLSVAAMRCLAIVEFLGRSRSANSALTLQKAAVFDLALKNPKVARRLLSKLAPEKLKDLELPQVLYPSETDMGVGVDKREITKVAALLGRANIISLESIDGSLVLRPRTHEAPVDISQFPNSWQTTLKALKSLTSKSVATLQRATFRESNHNDEQHVFIVGAPGTERRDQEL